MLRGGIDGLLDATDVRREGGHDHPALRRADELAERPDRGLRQGVALALGAGGVGQEEVDAAFPPLGDEPQVGAVPSGGVWSNLKSPVWITVPARVADREPDPARMEWLTRNG